MVFALRLAEGAKSVDNCPHLEADAKAALDGYLSGFVFDD